MAGWQALNPFSVSACALRTSLFSSTPTLSSLNLFRRPFSSSNLGMTRTNRIHSNRKFVGSTDIARDNALTVF